MPNRPEAFRAQFPSYFQRVYPGQTAIRICSLEQTAARVEIGTAAVHLQVSSILGNIAAGGVVDRMSICVRGQEGQSGPKTPLQSPDQGVIDRASRTLKNRHRAERRQRTPPQLDFRLVESWYRIG